MKKFILIILLAAVFLLAPAMTVRAFFDLYPAWEISPAVRNLADDAEAVREVIKTRSYVIPNGRNENYKIVYYIFDTQVPGPSIVILAGVHGNEPAGWYAAEYIIYNFAFERGRFLIIPRVSAVAVAGGTRHTAGVDLNRYFHRPNTRGNTAQRIVAVVIDIIAAFNPDAIIDLHETTPGGFTNTIIHYRHNRRTSRLSGEAARFAADAINATGLVDLDAYDARSNRPFREFRGAVLVGTTARELSLRFGVPAFLTETSRTNPIDLRIAQQLYLVYTLVEFFHSQYL